MDTIKRPQVRLKAATHKAASAAAATCKLSLQEYTEAALDYFTSRQLNPVEIEAREGQLIMQELNKQTGLTMQQVKKLGDRVFSYLQVQERGLLVPMLHEMLRTRITLDRVLRMNEILVNNLTAELEKLTEPQLARRRESLKKLRQQNEEMVEAQIKQAIDSTKPQPPGPPDSKGQLGGNGPAAS
jgi:hypothetical protein